MYCSLFLTVLVEFLAMSYILNAAVIWEEVWKVINMGGGHRFVEEKLTCGSPADVF